MIEASRVVLLRRIRQTQGARESIPPVRWLLAPWRTFLLWRRMALWQITSYRIAVDTELAVRRAVTLLRARYGRRWHRHAPADLVWMLRTGVAVNKACERVDALLGINDAVTRNAAAGAPATVDKTPACDSAHPAPDERDDVPVRSEAASVDVERLVEAKRLNRQHWMQHGRPVSAETLRQQLHVSAATSRELTHAVRAADRIALIAATTPRQQSFTTELGASMPVLADAPHQFLWTELCHDRL